MKRSIIALDLGTMTGWAATLGETIVSGTWDFRPQRFEGGGMRFVRFRSKVAELIKQATGEEPPLVYFEEVRRHAGTDAAHIYGGFMGQLTAYCDENAVPYEGVPVGTIKRHATGKGNADKAAMLAAAALKWTNYKCMDDNEADARWLLDLVTKR